MSKPSKPVIHQVSHKSFFRSKLLIYPDFQIKLIAVNVAVMAAALAFVAFQLKRSFSGLQLMGVNAHIPEGHAYFRFLDWQLGQMYSYFMIAFLGGVLLSGVVTLVLSNRVAGPIVRLRSFFHRAAKEGALKEQIRFRKGDFFPDLPEIINVALKRVTHKQSGHKPLAKKRAA